MIIIEENTKMAYFENRFHTFESPSIFNKKQLRYKILKKDKHEWYLNGLKSSLRYNGEIDKLSIACKSNTNGLYVPPKPNTFPIVKVFLNMMVLKQFGSTYVCVTHSPYGSCSQFTFQIFETNEDLGKYGHALVALKACLQFWLRHERRILICAEHPDLQYILTHKRNWYPKMPFVERTLYKWFANVRGNYGVTYCSPANNDSVRRERLDIDQASKNLILDSTRGKILDEMEFIEICPDEWIW